VNATIATTSAGPAHAGKEAPRAPSRIIATAYRRCFRGQAGDLW
jgi:hypothetical protein